jgi:hypothetical protein
LRYSEIFWESLSKCYGRSRGACPLILEFQTLFNRHPLKRTGGAEEKLRSLETSALAEGQISVFLNTHNYKFGILNVAHATACIWHFLTGELSSIRLEF